MIIRDMFEKDINRDINGVVKVAQDDVTSQVQELSEYIITRELRKHFATFFDNYARAIDYPTDRIGVWISGFFGSGKSHFLKMISYLLSNRVVAGKPTIEYFQDKFDDPMMYGTIVKCTSVPTESILFNIDVEGPINKDKTAILRVFTKVFYNHLGYHGDDLKIATLEHFIAKQGRTDAFRAVFEEVNGASWLDTRSSYAFFEDDIVEVLQRVLGMSEVSARNWFNRDDEDMSIKQLVDEIKDYVDSKDGDFRLLFCIDEVGQYIGDDGDLMINLQSIVEELGSKCLGKVWVMVTSQEAIDSVVKIKGDDFSKIQGRFNTRLSLSSSSVDEVIKKRILEKTEDADQLLRMVYDKEQAVLKNLYTFSSAVQDIKGYSDTVEFASTYPFVPYQFKIIPKVLAEIRKHGNSGKHLSGGERSMLSGFQEATQKIQAKDQHALVPFSLFYDTVHTFLESPIRRVIDRCQMAADNHHGIEQRDVEVLKLLYLVRYIDDFRANIDNIAILMIDDIRTDKIKLRAEISESLGRLEREVYVNRNGETYYFLTDEEQDITNEIRATVVDGSSITKSIGDTIFGALYPSRKFRYKQYDFDYDQYVDGVVHGSHTGGVRLHFVTEASDYYKSSRERFLLDSRSNNEVIILLSNSADYYNDLRLAAQIRKFIKQKNFNHLPESVQRIIRSRQDQAKQLEDNAGKLIERAIAEGTTYIYGEEIERRYGSAKIMIDEALAQLIASVYNKLDYVNRFYDSDAQIEEILRGPKEQTMFTGSGVANEFALNEISQWLDGQNIRNIPVSMGDVQRRYQEIPFGWKNIDIAALVAQLIVAQKIEIRYGGAVVDTDDRNLVRYLRNRNEVDRASVARRVVASEEDLRKVTKFLREWQGQMSVAEEEGEIVQYLVETLGDKLRHYEGLLAEYDKNRYPEKEVVQQARSLMSELLAKKTSNIALLKSVIAKQDEILDCTDDMEPLEAFFQSQREIFDRASAMNERMRNERFNFEHDEAVKDAIGQVARIISLSKPYNSIKDLPGLIQKIDRAYVSLLDQRRDELYHLITSSVGDIHSLAGVGGRAEVEVRSADLRFNEFRERVASTTSLTDLDAMNTQIINYKNTVIARINIEMKPPTPLGARNNGTQVETRTVPRIILVRRDEVLPPKQLTSVDEVNRYLEEVRERLIGKIQENSTIQIV